VEVAFAFVDAGNSRLLQQIRQHVQAVNSVLRYVFVLAEVNFDQFPESAAVVIPHCFRISECLNYRIARQKFVFQIDFIVPCVVFPGFLTFFGQILHDVFGALRFPGSTFPRDDH